MNPELHNFRLPAGFVPIDSPNYPVFLVYVSEDGGYHFQPLTDLPAVGMLVDLETGDDMELVGWTHVEPPISHTEFTDRIMNEVIGEAVRTADNIEEPRYADYLADLWRRLGTLLNPESL